MARIAFLGLGQMGAPMARRLLRAGHQLTVWDRTADHAKPFAAEGASIAASPAQAGAAAECAITMLATPDALQEVVFGGNGGLATAHGAGQVYVDMSTAPVRGSVSAATDGRLDIFVGSLHSRQHYPPRHRLA